MVDLDSIRQYDMSIAGVTEENQYCDANLPGFRALSMWLTAFGKKPNPEIVFTTYDLNTNNPNIERKIDMDRSDLDSVWNFIYFSYSYEQK